MMTLLRSTMPFGSEYTPVNVCVSTLPEVGDKETIVGGPADPEETTRFTAEPATTDVPAAGLSLITLPEGTVVLGAVVTVPTTNPAALMADVAAACVLPTTFGTTTSGMITVESVAVAEDAPPPLTTAVFTCGDVALAATFTVTVIVE